jgi:PKD repeat protein
MINSLTTIFGKDGSILDGPFASNAFWAGMGGNCAPNNQGDPVVLYDENANRWIVSQFAFPDNMSSFSQCVAVSKTGDPAGAYNRYEFSFNNIGLNDYPKHGIVSDSITMTANLFKPRGPFFNYAGTFLGVMDKEAMYAGQPASLIGFNIGTGEFGFVAGDLDDPSGSGYAPALFATAMSTSNAFDIWQIDVDWSTENASVSQVASIPITPFDADLCSASREACIPQPDGGPKLEALDDRLMHRLQIRDFGDYRSMVTAHTVDVGGGRAGIRWYEMREDVNGWSLYQEGTYAPDDGEYRWMPSAAMNAAGDIGIGYLLASTNTYVSTAVAGQSVGASGSGQLDSAEEICAAGSGVQEGVSRSGDYASTSIDPTSDTFWHTNEVFNSTGNYYWDTFVCEFSVAGSGGGGNNPPVASFTSECTDLDCTFTDTSTDSDGSIASRSWAFGDGGTSTAANPSHSYSSADTYTVQLTVTDNDGDSDTVSAPVTVTAPAPNTAPTADFTYSCNGLACSFTDASGDSDGTIAFWSWDFGDGNGSTAQSPSHTYGAENTYDVTLVVTDNDGATSDPVHVIITVKNNDPVASFTSDCAGLTCSFTDTSSDSDGSVTSWSWTFGDGGTSSEQNPSHDYGSGGSFAVMLTIGDNAGGTDSTSGSVSVSPFTLSATGTKVKGRHVIDLTWSGSGATDVDIYRDGSMIATVSNSGSYTDETGNRGGATYTYKVCEEGSSTACSNTVTVTF